MGLIGEIVDAKVAGLITTEVASGLIVRIATASAQEAELVVIEREGEVFGPCCCGAEDNAPETEPLH